LKKGFAQLQGSANLPEDWGKWGRTNLTGNLVEKWAKLPNGSGRLKMPMPFVQAQ